MKGKPQNCFGCCDSGGDHDSFFIVSHKVYILQL